VVEMLSDIARLERNPRMEGRRMNLLLARKPGVTIKAKPGPDAGSSDQPAESASQASTEAESGAESASTAENSESAGSQATNSEPAEESGAPEAACSEVAAESSDDSAKLPAEDA